VNEEGKSCDSSGPHRTVGRTRRRQGGNKGLYIEPISDFVIPTLGRREHYNDRTNQDTVTNRTNGSPESRMEKSKGMTTRKRAGVAEKEDKKSTGMEIVVKDGHRIRVYPAGRLSLGQAVLVILDDGSIYQYETFWDTVPQFDKTRWELMAQRGAEWVRGELVRDTSNWRPAEKVCPHKGSEVARESIRKAIDGGKALVVAIEPWHIQSGGTIKVKDHPGVFGNVLCKSCGTTMAPGTVQCCYGLKDGQLTIARVDSVKFGRGTSLRDPDGDYILTKDADPSRQLREESAEAERGRRGRAEGDVDRGLSKSEFRTLLRRAESVGGPTRKPWEGFSPITERSGEWRDPRGEPPALLERLQGATVVMAASDFGGTLQALRGRDDEDEFGSPLSIDGIDFSTPKARLRSEVEASEYTVGATHPEGDQQPNGGRDDREQALRLFKLVGVQSGRLENIERALAKSEEENRVREERWALEFKANGTSTEELRQVVEQEIQRQLGETQVWPAGRARDATLDIKVQLREVKEEVEKLGRKVGKCLEVKEKATKGAGGKKKEEVNEEEERRYMQKVAEWQVARVEELIKEAMAWMRKDIQESITAGVKSGVAEIEAFIRKGVEEVGKEVEKIGEDIQHAARERYTPQESDDDTLGSVLFRSAITTIGQSVDPLANGSILTDGSTHSPIAHRPLLARPVQQSLMNRSTHSPIFA